MTLPRYVTLEKIQTICGFITIYLHRPLNSIFLRNYCGNSAVIHIAVHSLVKYEICYKNITFLLSCHTCTIFSHCGSIGKVHGFSSEDSRALPCSPQEPCPHRSPWACRNVGAGIWGAWVLRSWRWLRSGLVCAALPMQRGTALCSSPANVQDNVELELSYTPENMHF